MKLIQQSKLFFQDQKSDKIYEVDLCEVGTDQYVVNFRYGKRGVSLKEGTKTIFPITYQQANTIYHKLVTSKLKKGYQDQTKQTNTSTASTTNDEILDIKSEVILAYLKTLLDEGKWRESWSLSRVFWRVGELKLQEATPHILRILKGEQSEVVGQHMREKELFLWHAAIWALGKCQDKNALPLLINLAKDNKQATLIQRFARQAVILIAEGATLTEFEQQLMAELPKQLQQAVQQPNHSSLQTLLSEYLFETKTTNNTYLTTLYILSYTKPHVRRALVQLLPSIPLQPNYYKHLRHLFKLAEFQEDYEIYSLLAYRFSYSPAGLHRSYDYIAGRWVSTTEELKKPNSRYAFSSNTKEYFKRRILRTLNKLGNDQSACYVPMATQLLLTISDQDLVNPYRAYASYDWNTRTYTYIHYDETAPLRYLNQILYSNSPRYELTYDGKWICKSPYEPGQPAPTVREEAFPNLWDAQPESLLLLLINSQCQRVHEFALKAFMTNPNADELISNEVLKALFSVPYAVTLEFALAKARARYDANHPDKELILALLLSQLDAARHLAIGWISGQNGALLREVDFSIKLLTAPHQDVRTWVSKTIPLLALNQEKVTQLITAIFRELPKLADETNRAIIHDLGNLLLEIFPKQVAAVDLHQILTLFEYPNPTLHELAGKLVIHHETPSDQLPDTLFDQLINSPHEAVQAIGIQLFGTLPIDYLLQRQSIILEFATSKLEAARLAARPIIGQLAQEDEHFAHAAIEFLTPILLKKEKVAGMHDDVYQLLAVQLKQQLNHINVAGLWKLLDSRYEHARQLGSVLILTHYDFNALAVKDVVKLAGHEFIQLRQKAWETFETNVPKMKYEREAALKLLESDWEDTRAFAFEFFKKEFDQHDWTPSLLVSICDSIREDVQTFGYTLITLFFEEKDGLEYLLKLSQHPSGKLQLFATNYLERFAQGSLERLKKLELYFVTVLSQINKGRVAKERVFQFLRTEAQKDAAIAQFVHDILKRQVNTVAIGDKATCIEVLSEIMVAHPQLGNALKIKEVRTYSKA
ncbi:MAG: hypothetical protein ACPGJS_17770 [Flammeovirgaceae bacterium]